MKKENALALILRALNEKVAGLMVYINNTRITSKRDLTTLYEWIYEGKEVLTNAYEDRRGFWHLQTIV